MKPLLFYLLETLFCSGLFVAVYRGVLVGHLSFAACRRYLLAACALSLLLPALRIPLYPAPPVPIPAHAAVATNPAQMEFIPDVPTTGTLSGPGIFVPAIDYGAWVSGCVALYGAVAALFLLLFIRRWRTVRCIRKQCHRTCLPDYTLAEGPLVRTPFSFLRTIFLPPGLPNGEREQILCHEASHVGHCHTIERIAAEVVRSICWYNPFVWMIGSDLREVQEWEADRDVLDRGYDLTTYRMLIFHQLFGYGPDLTCGLNHAFTKKRFLMMTHVRGGKHAFVRLCALVPAVAAMLFLCSFTVKAPIVKEGDPAATRQPAGQVAASPADGNPATFVIPGGRLAVEAERVFGTEEGKITFAGSVRLSFAESAEADEMSLRCDSLVLENGSGRAECFGGVEFAFGDGPLLRAGSLTMSIDPDGKPLWSADSVTGMQPVEAVAEIRIADGRILLDDEPVALSELSARLGQARSEGIETAILSADSQTPMSLVAAVKQAIQKAHVLKVRYRAPGIPVVSRILPPSETTGQTVTVLQAVPNASAAKVYPDGTVAIRERNFLPVSVNDKGEILVGCRGKKEKMDLDALKQAVVRFIRNADDDGELPEKEVKAIELPDGQIWNYPVSNGVVAFCPAQQLDYGTYLTIIDAITGAFGEIRDEAARAQFGRGYDALDQAERNAVNRAVPIALSEAEPR